MKSLNQIVLGTGTPRTLLLSGIHGNEKTGQLIISEFLKKNLLFTGTLTILPIANPSGFTANIREEKVSGIDLNRQFFDDNTSPVAEIIKIIIDLAKQQDYVIDLHNFTTEGLIQVVSNHIGHSDYLATLFKPDVVRCTPKEQELKKTGTLAKYLKAANIPYVLLELPIHTKISSEHINRIIAGFHKHLTESPKYSELIEDSFGSIPKVVIKLIKSDKEGIFEKSPKLALGNKVSQEDVLGTLETGQIYSPYAGIVCEMDSDEKRTVARGSTLVGIGVSP